LDAYKLARDELVRLIENRPKILEEEIEENKDIINTETLEKKDLDNTSTTSLYVAEELCKHFGFECFNVDTCGGKKPKTWCLRKIK